MRSPSAPQRLILLLKNSECSFEGSRLLQNDFLPARRAPRRARPHSELVACRKLVFNCCRCRSVATFDRRAELNLDRNANLLMRYEFEFPL